IRAESFSVRPALLENPNLQTTSDAYKTQNCPSVSELAAGVKFFITGYYKPAYGDKEKYQSFECNVAMQCSCPEPPGRSNEYSCKTAGNKTWRPCNNFDSSKSYCNKTSTGVEPTAWQTAATSSCLPKGTVFKVFGSKLPTVNSKVWVAEDSGGWITGRRVDLFTGQGSDAYKQAVDLTGEVMIKVCPNNDKTKCS
ncbi:MAG: 3D domain-containing protein, partial [Patescibacteria group bacterium]